jgi:hypothetical protein
MNSFVSPCGKEREKKKMRTERRKQRKEGEPFTKSFHPEGNEGELNVV